MKKTAAGKRRLHAAENCLYQEEKIIACRNSSYNIGMDNNDFGKIRLLVFDVDGTLAETDDYYIERFAVLQRKVLPFIRRETIEKAVRPAVMLSETVLHSFYRLLDMAGLDAVITKAHNKISVKDEYNYRVVEGVRETLALLSKYFPMGIITSGGRRSTMSFIEKYELQDMISFVISAEDCRFIKPHPIPLLKMAELAGVPVESCMLIGDTVFDILCAKRAGAFSAAVKTGFDSGRFLKLFHADLLLDSVNDLPGILLVGEKRANQAEFDGNKEPKTDGHTPDVGKL